MGQEAKHFILSLQISGNLWGEMVEKRQLVCPKYPINWWDPLKGLPTFFFVFLFFSPSDTVILISRKKCIALVFEENLFIGSLQNNPKSVSDALIFYRVMAFCLVKITQQEVQEVLGALLDSCSWDDIGNFLQTCIKNSLLQTKSVEI